MPMKKFGLLLIGSIVLLGSGCQKVPLFQPSMTANIGTLPFQAVGTQQVYCDSQLAAGKIVTITGATAFYEPGTVIHPVIMLQVPFATGTYSIQNNCNARVTTALSGSLGTAATSGTITVEGIVSNRIKGTFSLVCADGETISKGVFYCVFP